MAIIKFLSDDSIMDADIQLEGHRVVMTVQQPIATINSLIALGFQELNENNHKVMSDFSDHRYLYHEEIEHYVFIITNDPSDIWHDQPIPPEPPVPPTPPEPTLDEVKAWKIAEMERTMSTNITNGVTVTLSDGTTGTFGLSALNQTSLTNLRLMAEQAEDQDTPSIPWHVSDEAENCRYFAPKDIITITDAAIVLTTYQITFFRDLRIYINDLETKEEVNAITYDLTCLPREYWSEVLEDIVNRMNSMS